MDASAGNAESKLTLNATGTTGEATRVVSFDQGIRCDSKNSSVCNVVYIAEESEETSSKVDYQNEENRPKPVDLSSYLSGGQATSTFEKNTSHETVGFYGGAVKTTDGRGTSQPGVARNNSVLVAEKESMHGSVRLTRYDPKSHVSGQASSYSHTTVVYPKRQGTSVLSQDQPEGTADYVAERFEDQERARTIEVDENAENVCLSPGAGDQCDNLMVKEQVTSSESLK